MPSSLMRSCWLSLPQFSLLVAGTLVSGAQDRLRLDPNVAPTSQTVTLTVDSRQPSYSGSVHIELVVKEATNTFRFHAESLTLEKVVLQNESGSVGVRYELGEAGLVFVTTNRRLTPGPHSLKIRFSNDFNTRAAALYRVETEGHSYTFTQFEPWDARKAFPCWDEPAFKIPYQVSLVVPEAHEALANTPIKSTTRRDGKKTIVFEPTPPMPSYLLAIATGPFDAVSIPGLSFPARIVTVQGKTHLASVAAQMTRPLLEGLEEYFQRPYPYRKLDLIAVPEYSFGAMENPGAVTFLDQILLLDPNTASVSQRSDLAWTLAHELAHMWFGNLVTMEWWDDLWLNEAFADWLSLKVVDEVYPQYEIMINDNVRRVQFAMRQDAHLSSRAIRQPVRPDGSPEQMFDSLTYDKGRFVLGMVERWIGAELFRQGVRDYVNSHAWSTATAADLWRAVSAASGQDVGTVLGSFLDQPGLPLVQVEVPKEGRIRLRQKRFLPYGIEAPAPQTWSIPIVLRYSDGSTIRHQKMLLTEPVQTYSLDTNKSLTWIHLNGDEKGYYRWTSPAHMIQELAKTATTNLTVTERVGLIHQLGALVDSGGLGGTEYMQSLEHFYDDPHVAVLAAVTDAVYKVRSDFVVEKPDLRDAMAGYGAKLLRPALNRIGLRSQHDEAESVSLLRPRLISWFGTSRGGKDSTVTEYAASLAEAYLIDPQAVDSALAAVALQTVAEDGDMALFERVRAKFETTSAPAERGTYLSALGAFEDPTIVEAALNYVLEGPLRPQEYMRIPYMISGRFPQHQDRVLEWLMAHYDTVTAKSTPYAAVYMPWLARGVSQERLETAKQFFSEPDHAPPGTSIEMRKVMESVQQKIELRQREGPAVVQYLRAFLR